MDGKSKTQFIEKTYETRQLFEFEVSIPLAMTKSFGIPFVLLLFFVAKSWVNVLTLLSIVKREWQNE